MGLRVAVIGTGAVGARAARQVHSSPDVDEVVIAGRDHERVALITDSLADRVSAADPDPHRLEADVAVVAHGGDQTDTITALLRRQLPSVATSWSLDDVMATLDLDAEATERGLRIVPAATFAPGFTCVLAALASTWLERTDEIEIARVGTGGPACARQHHAAFRQAAWAWESGWTHRRPGTGRRLKWFPEPVGAVDCYHAALPESVLVARALPEVRLVDARLAATRRDRLTARLPMLRPPHPEGLLGGVVVSVRGLNADGVVVEHTLGAVDRPAMAAGTVAAVAAVAVGLGQLAPGVAGLAEPSLAADLVAQLADRGIKAAVRDPIV